MVTKVDGGFQNGAFQSGAFSEPADQTQIPFRFQVTNQSKFRK